ncbi:HXXEE domain-containing protein [Paenibacillus sp. TH7-28]
MEAMSLQTLVWLFIVAFVIHDLEEIIWVEPWMKRNARQVAPLLPAGIRPTFEKMSRLTSSQFAVAVLMEFIIFIPFTYMAAEKGRFFMFLAFNNLFFLHVFTHLGQSLYLKRYTPGVVTAVLVVLPYTTHLFSRLLAEKWVTWGEILLSVPVGFILAPYVLLGHEVGRRIVK